MPVDAERNRELLEVPVWLIVNPSKLILSAISDSEYGVLHQIDSLRMRLLAVEIVTLVVPMEEISVLHKPQLPPPSDGSIKNNPVSPNGAVVSTRPPSWFTAYPDASTCPPSPPVVPPLAKAVPWKIVLEFGSFMSDQDTIVPPSPSIVAEASRTVSV